MYKCDRRTANEEWPKQTCTRAAERMAKASATITSPSERLLSRYPRNLDRYGRSVLALKEHLGYGKTLARISLEQALWTITHHVSGQT